MSRRRPGRNVDLQIALAATIALLAAARGWPVAAIGYGAWALTWLVTSTTRASLHRALGTRRYRWHDIAGPEDIHPRSFPQDVKVAAAVRDGGMCQCQGCPACHWRHGFLAAAICGSVNEIQFDHIRPWSLGGPSVLANCRTLCGPCNRTKGASILP